jgi:ribonuclease P protein component
VRVGLIVPRHKRSAVDRNRLKRRLRELSRTRLLPALAPLGGGGDLVIRARPEAYGASFEALARQVERIGRDARRLLTQKPEGRHQKPESEGPSDS